MHSTRPNRFQSFTPLRTLRTALTPTSRRSLSSSSTFSASSTSSTPLTRTSSPHSSIREMLSLRRKPSVLEGEMEEEKHLFSTELEVLEPRPAIYGGFSEGAHVVGIFEVLDGKC
ncbi:hypothetical protein IQ06DRAFT_24904 [Phaeosphaeriaceae sp. SRC1lsM3a]|nr:hypothetical protein IQ06DRAFT_24904 [Stagonospora sp. SRC1lsM3a]